MQNPEFLQAAESLGRGLMSQVADPEMQTMMELFSNPANQELVKAKMEELKGDPELREVMEDIETNGQGAMMKYMQARVQGGARTLPCCARTALHAWQHWHAAGSKAICLCGWGAVQGTRAACRA